MNGDKDHIPDLVQRAVELLLEGEYDRARSALASIDSARLVSNRRAALRSRRSRLAHEKLWRSRGQSEAILCGPVPRIHSRKSVPVSATIAIFERDRFICRYSHCRRRTIYVPVLRALSRLFPDILPYQKNRRPLEDHIWYWTYGTSLEHRVSFPHGGTSDRGNLITACYECNDIKNMIHATDLGWQVCEVQKDDWRGLSHYLPKLMEALVM